MRSHRDRFVEGAVARGVEREVAERVFSQIHGFSGFGFPKSHAAAFGLLAYQSTWLRVHYGPEFLCALLNEQPMGFYPPDALVHEAQRRGIEVLGTGREPQRRPLPGGAVAGGMRTEGPASRCGSGSATSRGWRTRTPRPSSPSGCGAAPTGSSVSSPRARAPGGTGWSGSPGPAPAASSPARGRPGDDAGGCRSGGSGVARGALRRAGGEQLSLPLAVPERAGLRRADALGAGHGRLRRLRDLAGAPPAVPAARRAGPGDGHLRGARAGPRRQRPRRRRATRRPAAPRHRQGGDVPADRGRDRGRQRDRHPAGLRTPSADGADGLADHDRGPAGTPRGGDQRRRGERPADRAPGRPPRRGAHDRALPRRRPAGTSATSTPSSPPPIPSAAGADRCNFPCTNMCTSGPVPIFHRNEQQDTDTEAPPPPRRAFGVTAINRVADRIDLAIDLLTLGQYGLECREVADRAERLRGEQAPDPHGSRTAWEAPRTSRRPGCEWPWPQRPAPRGRRSRV